jgi:YHS domain-containing protein
VAGASAAVRSRPLDSTAFKERIKLMPTETASFDDGRVTTYRDDDEQAKADTDTRAVDPVCGMEVSTANSEVEPLEHDGQEYYFCSEDCRELFEEEPDKFAVPSPQP